MTPSKMNVAFSYLWVLPSGEIAQVRQIIEALRLYAIDLGSESVGDVIVLTGAEAQAVQPEARHVVMFTGNIPNATMPPANVQRYGLALPKNSPEEKTWAWSGVVRVSSFREISKLMHNAATLGVEVHQTFAGMIMTAKKNAEGVVVYDQRYAIDLTDF